MNNSKLSKIFFLLAGISLVCFGIVRFLLGVWVPFLWIMLGLMAGCLLAAIWTNRGFYKEFFMMKTTKQGMSMGAMIALVVVLLAAINFIAVRKYKTFDFSLARVNTLSDQSIQLLKGLKDDLSVIYFYKNGTEGVEANRRAFSELIRRYQDQTDKMKLEFVEVNEHPDLTEKYNVHQGTQTVIMDYQGRQARIEKIDEQELTSGIVKVTRTTEKKVYFLKGHAEFEMAPSKDGMSLSMFKDLLANNRYTVAEHSFTKSTQVPADADVLVIAGPRMAFLDVEVKALEDYLNRGGSLILALAPGFKTNLEPLLKHIGITPKNNFIATTVQTATGLAVDPRFARGSVFSETHQITKPFGKDQFTVFRLPTGLDEVNPAPAGMTLDDIVKTNVNVMGFKDMDFGKNGGSAHKAADQGPYTLGIAVKGKFKEGDAKDFNALVFGDANFLDDQYLYQNLNRDLALNSVSFLAKEENLISITPKEVAMTPLTMTEDQLSLFVFGFIIPLPLCLFAASGWLWYRRRYS